MARLLFVTSRLPFPPREGHQLRSWHLLRAAARRHEVHLLCLQRPEDGEPRAELRDVAASVTCVPLPSPRDAGNALHAATRWLAGGEPLIFARYDSAALRQAFREKVAQVDAVHLDILAVAGLRDLVPDGMPMILNEHNVESQLLRARQGIEASRVRSLLLRWQAAGATRFERTTCEDATRVLACSRDDAARLQAMAPRARIEVVPNGVDLQAFPSYADCEPAARSLVFVGQMGWFPNRDGIAWFLQDVMPRLPGCHLTVVGTRGAMQAPAALADAVQFTGFVDDLRPLVRDAAVYVVPLRAGSGTRLKILEAMAMGKALVSTRIGAEGIGLRHDEDALLADTADEFAAAIERVLADPALRRRLGRAARAKAEREYGWESIGDRLLQVYDDAFETRQMADYRPLAENA